MSNIAIASFFVQLVSEVLTHARITNISNRIDTIRRNFGMEKRDELFAAGARHQTRVDDAEKYEQFQQMCARERLLNGLTVEQLQALQGMAVNRLNDQELMREHVHGERQKVERDNMIEETATRVAELLAIRDKTTKRVVDGYKNMVNEANPKPHK